MAELSSREVVQRKIADALDYLGENLNIVDKSVREGKATNMDIARSFTGDVKSDKFVENIGLLDLTPLGTYFSFEEGEKAILKEEPDAFKRQMALLGSMRQPLQAVLDRPKIGLPVFDMMEGAFEGLTLSAVALKPVTKFLSSLKAKATEPLKDVGMNIQKTSLPTSGEANTTINIAENNDIDLNRRKFLKDTATVGALGALSTQVPDVIKMASKASKLVKPKITFASAQKAFIRPQLINYLEDMSDSEMGLADTVTDLLFDRVPAYRNMKVREIDEQGKFGKQYIKETYGIDDLNELSLDEIMDNEKLVDDLSIDVAGDDEFEFRYAVQQKALNDGAKIDKDNLLSEPAMDLYTDDKTVNERNKAVTDYYNTLKEEGKSPNDIAIFMREDIEYDTGKSAN
jgi:hypothetical protein